MQLSHPSPPPVSPDPAPPPPAGDAAQLLWHVNDWVEEHLKQPCMLAPGEFVRSSRALQRACVRLLLLQKAKMDGHLGEEAFADKSEGIVDEVVAERKLQDILVNLYKDSITQNKAEQLAASLIGLLPGHVQPTFKRQFPDLFEKREKSGELSVHTQGQMKPDRHGNTALHRAAAAGEVEKVKKLIHEASSAPRGFFPGDAPRPCGRCAVAGAAADRRVRARPPAASAGV